MALVTWWLSTKTGRFTSSELFVREVEMGFLPNDGDTVHITVTEDEPEGAVAATIYRRYWNFDGSAHIQFQHHVMDPPEDYRPNRMQTLWWTDRDGDLEVQLEASGWLTYERYLERRESA